ncbi:carbon-nitrogen hydrolase family protein [Caldiplasma sukawensis]
MKIKITGFQTNILKLDEVSTFLRNIDEKSDIIMFPERFINGVFEEIPIDIKKIFEEFSKGRTVIFGSILIRRMARIYNRSYVYNDGHVIGFQDKIVPYGSEKGQITGGNAVKIFKNPNYSFSVAVCYDIDFPFFAAVSSRNKSDMILNPSLIIKGFHDEWHTYISGRSLENRIPIISVNSLNPLFDGDSIACIPYEDDPGVRISKFLCENMEKFSVVVDPEKIRKRRDMRREEDPGIYSFPVKEIRYGMANIL